MTAKPWAKIIFKLRSRVNNFNSDKFGGYNIHHYPQTLRGIIVKAAGQKKQKKPRKTECRKYLHSFEFSLDVQSHLIHQVINKKNQTCFVCFVKLQRARHSGKSG